MTKNSRLIYNIEKSGVVVIHKRFVMFFAISYMPEICKGARIIPG